MKIHGFDDLMNTFDNLLRNAESISGENEIPLEELLSTSFIHNYTAFTSIGEFEDSSGLDFSNLEEIDSNLLDQFVSEHTKFSSWDDMLSEAGKQWAAKKLGL